MGSAIVDLSSSIATHVPVSLSSWLGAPVCQVCIAPSNIPQPNARDHTSERPSRPFEEGLPHENATSEQGGFVTVIDLDNHNYRKALSAVDQDLDDDVNSSIVVIGPQEKSPGGRAKRKYGSIHQHFKVISHFKATVDVALSTIAFDSTGTMIAAASERGMRTL